MIRPKKKKTLARFLNAEVLFNRIGKRKLPIAREARLWGHVYCLQLGLQSASGKQGEGGECSADKTEFIHKLTLATAAPR